MTDRDEMTTEGPSVEASIEQEIMDLQNRLRTLSSSAEDIDRIEASWIEAVLDARVAALRRAEKTWGKQVHRRAAATIVMDVVAGRYDRAEISGDDAVVSRTLWQVVKRILGGKRSTSSRIEKKWEFDEPREILRNLEHETDMSLEGETFSHVMRLRFSRDGMTKAANHCSEVASILRRTDDAPSERVACASGLTIDLFRDLDMIRLTSDWIMSASMTNDVRLGMMLVKSIQFVPGVRIDPPVSEMAFIADRLERLSTSLLDLAATAGRNAWKTRLNAVESDGLSGLEQGELKEALRKLGTSAETGFEAWNSHNLKNQKLLRCDDIVRLSASSELSHPASNATDFGIER